MVTALSWMVSVAARPSPYQQRQLTVGSTATSARSSTTRCSQRGAAARWLPDVIVPTMCDQSLFEEPLCGNQTGSSVSAVAFPLQLPLALLLKQVCLALVEIGEYPPRHFIGPYRCLDGPNAIIRN